MFCKYIFTGAVLTLVLLAGCSDELAISDDLQSSSNVNLNSDINENYSSKELSDKMVKAQAQLNSGNLENSLALVNEVISYNKHYHLAFQFKGVVLIEMNRKREAWDAFMESVHIGSGDVDDYLYLAEISLEFHNLMSDILAVLELKLKDLHRVNIVNESAEINIFYDEVAIYMAMSEVFVNSDRYDKAIDILIEGLGRNTGSVYLFDALLFSFEHDGRVGEASIYKEKYCHNILISRSRFCDK